MNILETLADTSAFIERPTDSMFHAVKRAVDTYLTLPSLDKFDQVIQCAEKITVCQKYSLDTRDYLRDLMEPFWNHVFDHPEIIQGDTLTPAK